MPMSERTLLVPVEVRARELRSRLLFGAAAVRRGWRVLLGESRMLHDHPSAFPTGVVVENDVTTGSLPYLQRARRLGCRVVAWDEEAIATVSDDWYVAQRVAPDSLALVDRLYTLGPGNRDTIAARFPGHASRLRVAGNPRIDLLRHEAERRRASGPTPGEGFILVVSRFSRSNPFSKTREEVLETVRKKFELDDEAFAFYEGFLDHSDEIFRRFLEMVRKLPPALDGRRVVLRPHPSESPLVWEQVAAEFPYCEVRLDGTATEWADHADAVIHNGCTAGLEAALLGRPVIAYLPVVSDLYDVPLPNAVSTTAETVEDVVTAIEDGRPDDPNAQRARLERSWELASETIAGCTGPTAVERILDDLETMPPWESSPTTDTVRARLRDRGRRTRRWWRQRASRLDSDREEAREAYRRQKFSPVSLGDLRAELALVDAQDIAVRPARKGWWELYPRAGG